MHLLTHLWDIGLILIVCCLVLMPLVNYNPQWIFSVWFLPHSKRRHINKKVWVGQIEADFTARSKLVQWIWHNKRALIIFFQEQTLTSFMYGRNYLITSLSHYMVSCIKRNAIPPSTPADYTILPVPCEAHFHRGLWEKWFIFKQAVKRSTSEEAAIWLRSKTFPRPKRKLH